MRFGVRRIARAIARATIENEEHMLTFTEEGLKEATWEHEDEFRLNGALYDVAKVTVDSLGISHYHCREDVLETALEARCDTLALSPAPSGEQCLHARFSSLSFDWYKTENDCWPNRQHQTFFEPINQVAKRTENDKPCSGFFTNPGQPPELQSAA